VAFPTTTQETFTPEETRALAPYFTNTDRPVVVLRNLPETVKGALFARYSRSAKSVRRLFSASTETTRSRSSAARTSPAKGSPTS
jgi:hypothetical protein